MDIVEGFSSPTLNQALTDLVFIANGSHVVSRSSKRVRKFEDACREYAASMHPVPTGKIDDEGAPVVKMVPVLKKWLTDPDRASVDVATWIPGQSEICAAPERSQAGERAFNLWGGLKIITAPGNWQEWVQPFLDHVMHLVPVESERKRFLQWTAHIFQKPEELPHTCYLFIATTTGIGRGTLASILTRALRGYVAANMDVQALFGGFNGRISQKLLATVDEVREGNSSQRYEKQEAFKSKLTEEVRSLNPKYGMQSVERNCCRWLLFSNHLDALPFDNGDRRIIVVENPTSRRQPEHYAYLHQLMSYPDFIASVQKYFLLLDLSDFSAHEQAPMNAAKTKALASLESEADRAARQFAATWPDDLATVADLKDFMGENPTAATMKHLIERVGMGTAGKRRVAGKLETILIVRGELTADDIRSASSEIIATRIISAQTAFRAQ